MSQHVHSKAEPHNNRHRGHTVPTLSYTRAHQVLLEHWLCAAILTEVWRGLIKTGGEYTEAKAPRKKVQCPTAEGGCSRNEEKIIKNWISDSEMTVLLLTAHLFEIPACPSPAGRVMEDRMLPECGWSDRELMKMLHLRSLRGKKINYTTNIMNKNDRLHCKCTFDVLVHILDDAGECGHMLLCQRHAQVVADEIVPGFQHRGGDEVENTWG